MSDLEARLREDARTWQNAVGSDWNPDRLPRHEGVETIDLESGGVGSTPRRGRLALASAAAVAVLAVAAGGGWLAAVTNDQRQDPMGQGGQQSCLAGFKVGGVLDLQSLPSVLSVNLTNGGDEICQVRREPPSVQVLDHLGDPVGPKLRHEHGASKATPPPVAIIVKPGHSLTFGVTHFVVCRHVTAAYSLRVRLRLANSTLSRTIDVPIGTFGGRINGCPSGAHGAAGAVTNFTTRGH